MIPDDLARAWTPADPGQPVPPGPRTNPWAAVGAVPVVAPPRVAALLDGLWNDGGPHMLPDGARSHVARRPVPSAGGAYPVQTHLVVGDVGFDGLDPGRYVLDDNSATLLRRGPVGAGSDRTHLVFTVLPGRSYSRYRHRSWPLWIADTAYAVAAVEFLCATHTPVMLGPDRRIRSLLGFAPATDTNRWTDAGLVPEIALAATTLSHRTAVSEVRRTALRSRRSPAVADFASRIGRQRPTDGTVTIAQASQQRWVLGADHVRSWTVSPTDDAQTLLAALWSVHRAAAHLVYRHALDGRRTCRPVSGTTLVGGRWPVHAVASLDRRATEERR
ncbi:nitroreductase family protein [Gordonia sp. MP11Mi]